MKVIIQILESSFYHSQNSNQAISEPRTLIMFSLSVSHHLCTNVFEALTECDPALKKTQPRGVTGHSPSWLPNGLDDQGQLEKEHHSSLSRSNVKDRSLFNVELNEGQLFSAS